MARRCSGSALMFAGLILTLVGVTVGLAAAFQIPGYWTTALVGIALFAVGAARRAVGGRTVPPRAGTQ